MNDKPEEFILQAWKAQLDSGLRAIEALVEGATQIHEAQLEAATAAHADAVATQKAMASASSPDELMRLQAEWTRANAEKCLAYWRCMYETTMQTNAEVAKCLCGQAAAPGGEKRAQA